MVCSLPKIKCLALFLSVLDFWHCDAGEKRVQFDIGKQMPKLLIISIDGLSPEMFYMNETPTLNWLRAVGVYSPYLQNVVPSFTAPALHSIATGRFPSEHGVYGSKFWDVRRGEIENEDVYNYDAEVLPIWAIAEKHKKRTGCMQWPGSEYQYQRYKCSYVMGKDVTMQVHMDAKARASEALGWFKHSIDPTDLVMMHFDDIATVFKNHGTRSRKIIEALRRMDDLMKYITARLNTMNLEHQVNVIVLSGHGYHSFVPTAEQIIDIRQYMKPEFNYRFFGESPILEIVPTTADKAWKEYTVQCLEIVASAIGTFKVYTPETLPETWKNNKAKRFGPVLIVAEPGFAFHDVQRKTNREEIGLSGYDKSESMHGTFMAFGPLVRPGVAISAIHSVDLLNLFCKFLDIPCSTNSGNDRSDLWSKFLKKSSSQQKQTNRNSHIQNKTSS